MSLRFRRSLRVIPGFRFNVSKTGVSETIGSGPLHVNLRDGRVMTTVSAPGTGLSYRIASERVGNAIWFGIAFLLVLLYWWGAT